MNLSLLLICWPLTNTSGPSPLHKARHPTRRRDFGENNGGSLGPSLSSTLAMNAAKKPFPISNSSPQLLSGLFILVLISRPSNFVSEGGETGGASLICWRRYRYPTRGLNGGFGRCAKPPQHGKRARKSVMPRGKGGRVDDHHQVFFGGEMRWMGWDGMDV